MSKKYNLAVFIGRFQPFHNAHLEIVKEALEISHKVLIIVGSANQPRTFKNPFTTKERKMVIFQTLLENGVKPYEFTIESNYDTIYDDEAWATRIQSIVRTNSRNTDRICIVGHEKDESSFYLRMFPQWTFESVDLIEPLNATDIRDIFFQEGFNPNYLKNVVPEYVLSYLKSFANSFEYKQIIRERKFIEDYKKQFAGLPYTPVFVTTDNIVLCQAHVLMVRRKSEPGRGLWALPGGFLNANTDKSVLDGAIRELKEETNIKVPVPVLKGSITGNRVFDAISRSSRGRTITHAFKYSLNDLELPKVKGMDDAEIAKWIPLSELDPSTCFEDHYEMIQAMI